MEWSQKAPTPLPDLLNCSFSLRAHLSVSMTLDFSAEMVFMMQIATLISIVNAFLHHMIHIAAIIGTGVQVG